MHSIMCSHYIEGKIINIYIKIIKYFDHLFSSFIFSTFALVLQLLGQDDNAAKAYSKAKKLELKEPCPVDQTIIGLFNKCVFYADKNKEKSIAVISMTFF